MLVAKWFENEIVRGLQGLVVLRLAGAPPEDSISYTLDIWLAALAARAKFWNEQQDAPRIRQAFAELYRTEKFWPAPRHFLDALPERPKPKRPLLDMNLTKEQQQQNKQKIAALQRDLSNLTKYK